MRKQLHKVLVKSAWKIRSGQGIHCLHAISVSFESFLSASFESFLSVSFESFLSVSFESFLSASFGGMYYFVVKPLSSYL